MTQKGISTDKINIRYVLTQQLLKISHMVEWIIGKTYPYSLINPSVYNQIKLFQVYLSPFMDSKTAAECETLTESYENPGIQLNYGPRGSDTEADELEMRSFREFQTLMQWLSILVTLAHRKGLLDLTARETEKEEVPEEEPIGEA